MVGHLRRVSRGQRHPGPAHFSSGYFEALSQLPGLTTFAAVEADKLVAATLWVRADDCAYYHLAASRPEGYRSQAMYGLVAMAIDHFRDCGLLHLGGVAGAVNSSSDGLARFKRGFANDVRVARLCGAVLNRERYAELTKSAIDGSFFPTYRVSPNHSPWEGNWRSGAIGLNSGRPHLFVSRQVENLFKKHGDTHTGLGYPKPDGYQERQKVFLDVMRFDALKPAIPKVFDIGCATGILLDYYVGSDVGSIHYRGVDLSGNHACYSEKETSQS